MANFIMRTNLQTASCSDVMDTSIQMINHRSRTMFQVWILSQSIWSESSGFYLETLNSDWLDSWGYRPVAAGNSAKVFYPSDHPEGSSEMKGTLRSWAQLQFPKLCLNYVQDGLSPLSVTSSEADRFPPPRSIKSPTGAPVSLKLQTNQPDIRN